MHLGLHERGSGMRLAAAESVTPYGVPVNSTMHVVWNHDFDRRATALFEDFRVHEQPETFRSLYESSAPLLLPMVRMKLRKLGRKLDAGDVLLDTFAHVYRNRATFIDRGQGSFVKWFLAVAENLVLQDSRCTLRRMRRERLVARRVLDPASDPFVRVLRGEEELVARVTWNQLRVLVLEGVTKLPPPQSEALVRFTQERVTYEELARLLGITRGAVVMRVQRARLRILEHVRARLRDPEILGQFLQCARTIR